MRYRPTTEPRGKWAIAINAKRRADKLSRTAAFEILGPKLGYSPKSLSAFRLLDIGDREPDENEAQVLADWLGYWPTDEPAPAPLSDTDAIVAAIDRQTDMLKQVLNALTQRTLDPTLVSALEQWGLAQAATLSQLSVDPAGEQSAPIP